jgi:hypothetical protein
MGDGPWRMSIVMCCMQSMCRVGAAGLPLPVSRPTCRAQAPGDGEGAIADCFLAICEALGDVWATRLSVCVRVAYADISEAMKADLERFKARAQDVSPGSYTGKVRKSGGNVEG